ncbi:MAG: hypothetical protein ACOH1V_02255 [Stenotrophomonas sp.]
MHSKASDAMHATYELAWNEIRHAHQSMSAEAFTALVDQVEKRLTATYPAEEVAIIEMVAAWLVTLGVAPPKSLRGFV